NGKLQILDGATALRVQTCPANHSCGVDFVNIGAGGNDSGVVIEVTDVTEGDAETWTATCTDVDANTPAAPDSFVAKVDFTPPSCGALTLTTTDTRRGILHAAYVQPGDTGTTGTATSIQLAFGRNVVVNDGNFGGAGQIVVDGPAGAGGGNT